MTGIRKFFRDDSGAIAAEYVILVAYIAITIISIVAILGSTADGLYIKTNGIFGNNFIIRQDFVQ